MRLALTTVLALVALTPAAWAASDAAWLDTPVPAKPDQVDLEAGKWLYLKRCSFCHGVSGEGNGPVAPYLEPRPRDFTFPQYKLRTTVSGELPTDEDLFRTISRGMPGSAMPSWEEVLTKDERWNLVAYIKTFSEDFEDAEYDPYRKEEGEGFILDFGEGPAVSEKLLAEGENVYTTMGKCVDCHGEAGRGDGKSAGTHMDDWENRIWPRDLTKPWRYRGGTTAREIFRTLTTGMSGTPMPSYVDALVPDDRAKDERARWAVAHYVRSLQRPVQRGGVLKVRRVDVELPTDPDDEAWEQAPELDVPLFGQVILKPRWQTPSVDLVRVRALHNGKRIAFRLEYSDRRADRKHDEEKQQAEIKTTYPVLDLSEFPPAGRRDAVALQFPAQPTSGVQRPYLAYGQPGKPVILWRYLADREGDADASPVEEILAEGPRKQTAPRSSGEKKIIVDEDYIERSIRDPSAEVVKGFAQVPMPQLPLTDNDIAALVAFIKNLGREKEGESERTRNGKRLYQSKTCFACHSLDGSPMPGPTFKGLFGREETVLVVGEEKGGVAGRGTHAQGQWRVVFSREMSTDREKDVAFTPGAMVPFTVMAWDGANGEHGLMHSLSSWYHLELEAPVPAWGYFKALLIALAVVAFEIYLLFLARQHVPTGRRPDIFSSERKAVQPLPEVSPS